MTLSMAWIRTVGSHEELVFASNSRLSGGADWDSCPKLMLLPRGDSLIGFAGSTLDAYPLMLQFRNWIARLIPVPETVLLISMNSKCKFARNNDPLGGDFRVQFRPPSYTVSVSLPLGLEGIWGDDYCG